MDRKINIIKQALERKGFRAHTVKKWTPNKFGSTFIISFDYPKDNVMITFVTNAVNGHNYFYIEEINSFETQKTFKAARYFRKYISLVSELNGSIFLLNKENEPTK